MATKKPTPAYLQQTPTLNLEAGEAFLASMREASASEAPTESRGKLRWAADSALSLGRGAVSGVRMLSDVAGADNAVSGALRSVDDYLGELQSAQAQGDQQRISQIMKDAENKGVLDQVIAAGKAFGVAPVQTLLNAVGTSIPTLAAAAIPGAGPAMMVARARTIGAMQGAGNTKGSIYETVKAELKAAGATDEEAEMRAAQRQSYAESGKHIAAGGVLGALAGSTGAERAFGGLVRGVAPKTVAGKVKEAPGTMARMGKAAAIEGGTEGLQGGQEKYSTNAALYQEGFDQAPFAGVAGSSAMEAMAGGVMGAGFAAPTPREIAPPAPAPVVPPAPPAGTLGRAAKVAQSTGFAPLEFTPTEIPKPGAKPKGADLALAEDKKNADATALEFEADPRFAGAATFGNGQAPKQPIFPSKTLADIHIGETGALGELEPVQTAPGQWTVQQTPEAANRTARANIEMWMGRAQPMTEEAAKDVAKRGDTEFNRPMAALPMPDGRGWTVVPKQWVSAPVLVDYMEQAQAAAAVEEQRQQDRKTAATAPVDRAPRTPKPAPAAPAAPADLVATYVEQRRTDGTPAGRAFAREFDAGRVTRDDVQALIGKPPASPDERLAAAAAQAPKETPQPGDILNSQGKPLTIKRAAIEKAKENPGSTIVAVEGGYVVRPKTLEPANLAPAPKEPKVAAPPADADIPTLKKAWNDAVKAGDTAGAAAINDRIVAAKQSRGPAASKAWVDEGKTPEQLLTEKADRLGTEFAGILAEESGSKDFKPSEVPQGLAMWAENEKVPADELRRAVLAKLDSFDIGEGRKRQIRAALDPTKAKKAAPPPAPAGAEGERDGQVQGQEQGNGQGQGRETLLEPKDAAAPAEKAPEQSRAPEAAAPPSPPAPNARTRAVEKKAAEAKPAAPRETITPANDPIIGKNAAGEELHKRADGSVYRMRFDRKDKPAGYPDFGGDLSPVAAKAEPTPAAPEQQAPATHKDPGQPAEPVTPAVVKEAIAKAADKRDRPIKDVKADALRLIDEAIARAPSSAEVDAQIGVNAPITERGKKVMTGVRRFGDKTRLLSARETNDGRWTVTDESYDGSGTGRKVGTKLGELQGTPAVAREQLLTMLRRVQEDGTLAEPDMVTIKVPGDGEFKVVNTKERLDEFRKKVENSPGFKTQRPGPLVAARVNGARGGYGDRAGMGFGVESGSTSKIAAFNEMVSDDDLEAASDYADATGLALDPKDANAAKVLKWRESRPTPVAEPEATPTPERPEALIELRKRMSVLESLRRCIAS
jgi:hypothetical protein